MTVSRHRRRMSTTRAAVASLVGVVLALALGVAGAVAVYNSKDGQVQGSDIPEVRFPDTPTGALAVLDDDGSLASLSVFTILPPADGDEDGAGGTVVPIPVSADVSGGLGSERLPLDETVSLFGSETLAEEVPALLGVSIDETAVVDQAELTEALASIGETEVTLPIAATNSDGTVLVDAGVQRLNGAEMAAILSSRDSSSSAADEYAVDFAVWQAIADAVGDGLPTPLTLTDADRGADAASGGDPLGQVTSGPVSVQGLRFDPIVSVDVNPRGVDALALDRVEVALVFGHIAPTRVAAPYAGYSFRVVSPFSDDQLPAGDDRLDVSYTAVKEIFELDGNVRSVDASAGEAPTDTIIEVANDSLIPAAEQLGDVFGPVDVRLAGTRIAGIDIIVTLGTNYLATLDVAASTEPGAPADATAGTVGPQDSLDTSVAGDTTVEGTS